MKKLILKIFAKAGYKIIKKNNTVESINLIGMQGGLRRLKDVGIYPKIVVDIGAAKGSWTNMSLDIFPDANYILVEPLREQIENIPKIISNKTNVTIIEGVAGVEQGMVKFSITKDLDGSGIYGNGDNQRKVEVFSIDELLKDATQSVLLKLDTHGFEIPIFEGAKESLKKTDAIVVEVYGFHVSPTGKLFHELSSYLSEKGFRVFDIIDIMRRPKDKAFWQADVIYLKSDHPIFYDDSYQ